MKLFSDFSSCYCGTANASPPSPKAAPSPLPDDAHDRPRRRHLARSKTLDPSIWRPKLSAISEDRVVSPPPHVADEKIVEREEGGSRKRWRKQRSPELKKSATFNNGDEQFVRRRTSSFSIAMRTFSASPFMI